MSTKLFSALKSNLFTANNIRIALFVMTLVLLVLGAGAPSDGGGLGGFAASMGGGF